MTIYYTSSGTEIDCSVVSPRIVKRGKKGIGRVIRRNCGRCGGEGGSSAWAMTGYTCYNCHGRRTFEEVEALYTPQQFEKLNARRQATQEKRQEAQAIREAEQQDKADALRSVFLAAYDSLLARARPLADKNEFIKDVLATGDRTCRFSDKQVAALTAACDREETSQRETATRGFLGDKEGDKIEFTAKVTKFNTRAGFGWNTTLSVWSFKTDNGSIVRYRGNALDFAIEVGDTVKIAATVKAHFMVPDINLPMTFIIRPKIISRTKPDLEEDNASIQ